MATNKPPRGTNVRIAQVWKWIHSANSEEDRLQRILAATSDENPFVREWAKTKWRGTIAAADTKAEGGA